VRKPSHHINRKAGASLLHAPRTAKAIGRPLNAHVTVSLWQIGIADHEAFDMFAKLRNQRFQRWSTYTPAGRAETRNGSPTHAWVFEAPNEQLHLHWMVHIQSGNMAAFRTLMRKWVARAAGIEELPEGVMSISTVSNAEGLKLYLSKGLDPHFARLWNIRPQPQGVVLGPRCGTSRNIGPSIRKPLKEAWKRSRRAA